MSGFNNNKKKKKIYIHGNLQLWLSVCVCVCVCTCVCVCVCVRGGRMGMCQCKWPETIIWLLVFFVLETYTVISRQIPTCDSAHSWWPFSAAPLGDQVTSTMICYPAQLHYPEPPSPSLLSTELESDKCKFLSHWFDLTWVQSCQAQFLRSPRAGVNRSTHSANASDRECMVPVQLVPQEIVKLRPSMPGRSFRKHK